MQKILLIDDDQVLVSTLGSYFGDIENIPFLGFTSYQQMIDSQDRVLDGAVTLAILDINLGYEQPSGIDAFHWLRQHIPASRIVFLTGHGADHPLVAKAKAIENVRVLSKPIDLNTLKKLVQDASKDESLHKMG